MKILLLNDNPVVNKLVTLSAQKTSDELEVVSSVDEIEGTSYDLFIVDDALYSDELIDEIKNKVEYDKSLYICARDADEIESFTSTLKKPFLPTDLVELFLVLGKEASAINLEDETPTDNEETLDDTEDIEELEEFNADDLEFDKDDLEEVDLEDIGEDEESELEDFEEIQLHDELEVNEASDDGLLLEDLELDEELVLDDLKETETESVLDIDELKEVQDLLEETEENTEQKERKSVEFSYDLDSVANELSFSKDMLLEFVEDFISQAKDQKEQLYNSLENQELGILKEESHKLKGVAANLKIIQAYESLVVINTSEDTDLIKDELDNLYTVIDKLDAKLNTEDETKIPQELDEFESKVIEEIEDIPDAESSEIVKESEKPEENKTIEEDDDEFEFEMPEELENQEEDIETQIQNAVEELSDEELQSELDEETLLDIDTNELNDIDALSSRELKLAIGEEIDSVVDEVVQQENIQEIEEEASVQQDVDNKGVEALKKLLEALSDKDVVASLKGMKININITLGDN